MPLYIRAGFANVKWQCRFEIISRDPFLILDSAHNEDSFIKLAQTLEDYFPNKKATLILGVSEDKHLDEMLAAIKHKLSCVIVTQADHPRALDINKVLEYVNRAEIEAVVASTSGEALTRALTFSKADGSVVLSAGSMFVTAEVKSAWIAYNKGKEIYK